MDFGFGVDESTGIYVTVNDDVNGCGSAVDVEVIGENGVSLFDFRNAHSGAVGADFTAEGV
jgi:hypothetical protein